MNFIKKKIKGHKRGHESDDEVEAAIYAKQLAEQQQGEGGAIPGKVDPFQSTLSDQAAPTAEEAQAKKCNSEEWRFFEQLTQRVQDTVQKTQTTLSKIKETSAIAELNKPDYYLEPEPGKAPPEDIVAIAPVASPARSWVNFEDGQVSSATEPAVTAAAAPPPRPPPPTKPKEEVVREEPTENSREINGEERCNVELELLEEFGFAPREQQQVSLAAPVLLDSFLEGSEEPVDDPFDTSFVEGALLTPKEGFHPVTAEEPEASVEDDPFDTSFVSSYVAPEVASTVTPPPCRLHEDPLPVSLDPYSLRSPPEVPTASVSDSGIPEKEEMSNPFLVDSASATTGESLFGNINGSSCADPEPPLPDVPNFFSGSRRSSTNPFDNLEEDLEFFRSTLVGAGDASGVDDTSTKGAELFQAIASTFPCEGQREPEQEHAADLFEFGDADDGVPQTSKPTFDPFKGTDDKGGMFAEAEDGVAEVVDPFMVAFGKASVDHDLSPDKPTPTEESLAQGGLFGGGSVDTADEQAVTSPPEKGSFTAGNVPGDIFQMKEPDLSLHDPSLRLGTEAPVQIPPEQSFFGSTQASAEEQSSFDPFSDINRNKLEPVPVAVASITPQREDFSPFDIGEMTSGETDRKSVV